MERFAEANIDPPICEVEGGSYMLMALQEVGPSMAGPMGSEQPITWSEVAAYMVATRKITESWEAVALVKMSQAYCRGKKNGEYHAAKYPGFD